MKLAALLLVAVAACAQSQTPSHTQLILKPGDTVVVIAAKDTTTPPPPNGPTHEPPGMTPQINTGHITTANTTFGTSGSFGTVHVAGPIPATWTNFSPTTTSATGENRANLSIDPLGGFMVTYPTNVAGGNSPVRYGTGIPGKGTGTLYSRERIRFANYIAPNSVNGVKLWEPRTDYQGGTTGENHVIGARWPTQTVGNQTTATPMFFLQGPNGQSRNLEANVAPPINIADGKTHTVEMLEITEAVPGQATGEQDTWVDGTLIAHYTNVQYLASGQVGGWPYWMSDPTYGGAPANQKPPHQWSVTHDSIYVSTK